MKKQFSYIFLTLILLTTTGLKGQSSYSKNNAHIQRSLLDSAQVYVQSKPDLAFDFVSQALEEAMKLKDRFYEAECYKTIGNINMSVQQYDLAIKNYEKALFILEQEKSGDEVFALNQLLAKAYQENQNLEKSEKIYKEGVATARSASSKINLRSSKRGLAVVYSKKGEDEKAVQELEELRQMDLDEENTNERFETNQQLIDVYSANFPSKALELSDENEAIARTAKDTIALLNTLQKKVQVFDMSGNSDEALSTLQQSLEVREAFNDIQGQSDDNLKIGNVLLEQKKLDDAISYLEKSVRLSEQSRHSVTKKEALKSLSSVYDEKGDYNRALEIYKEYVSTSEKVAREREEKILQNLELVQSMSKKLQRIDMLENQKLLDDRTIEVLEREKTLSVKAMKQQGYAIAALSVVLLLLMIAVFLIMKSSRQKRIANQLLALKSLRSQMNPHFIFNALNSVNSFISMSDERAANKYLSDFSRLMRAVMENSKHDFVSLASEVQILKLYLKLEHHRFREKFDYAFDVDPKIDQENVQIPPMLIQPYIENAVWHGLRYRDSKGWLNVQIENGKNIKVIIEDNGIGRKKSAALKTKNQKQTVSTGLENINHRIKIINEIHGTDLKVTIDDLDKAQETGTSVVIEIVQMNSES